jgi:transcriptional regulator with XRE-family HTH domain
MTIEKAQIIYNKMFIGMNLKKVRESYRLSTMDVAKILGKTRQAYENYERGNRDISVNDLIILSGYYNLSLDSLASNPFSTKSDNSVSFLCFKEENGEGVSVPPISVSTIYDDVICYEKNENKLYFFWKTNVNNEGHEMLFHYYNQIFVSKIYFKSTGGGHFYINGEPKYFNKAHAENIVIRGVLMATLNKDIVIDEFFR